ncbi:CDF family cation-efflux transporter FieF [Candidatus Enterovibrio altilux]|uniref:Cation-efflux pump FieF n=1 Tax=Candidatus Enterovibrio altilux TaxID=1927128 RepID=A0A291B6D1_9GAMM|nr:CDF family cation-efflux transporter FieF [Candidatus Enterovibrio luxaltus]ATF08552.1 Cobalt-zinc-cadmium resistance protein [Candidatus Enterovibrio luxaltus]
MNKNYVRLVKMAAWAATITATGLLVIKFFTWWYTDSVSLLASLVDSLIDLLASITNLVVVRYALQPADEEHRFGHGKAESLAALVQAVFIVSSAGFLLFNGMERLFRPSELHHPEAGIVVSIIAAIITGCLVLFQKWVVYKTGSQAISADSIHYQSDLLMNIAIIVALSLAWYGVTQADAVFALFIVIFILASAFRMIKNAVQSLLDHQLSVEDQEKIMLLTSTVAGVHGVHDLRTRQAGITRFIQLHLELDDNIKLVDAHLIADEVESRLEVAFPMSDVLIHQDPASVVGKDSQE